MKELKEVLENYEKYKVELMDRLGSRLINFLDPKEVEKIGFQLKEDYEPWEKIEWTEDNILKQLKKDVFFGYEKAIGERGISSSLMAEVVLGWNKVLENGLDDLEYYNYGLDIFLKTAKFYGWLDELV